MSFHPSRRNQAIMSNRRPQRPNRSSGSNHPTKESTNMKKFGFATIAAGGLAAAILGLAAPAQAATAVNTPISVASAINIPTDFGHHAWVVDIQPRANVPHR
jgi:hypothetical protein